MDDDRWYDINAIAGAFKMFMRELPDRALGAEALEELKNLTGRIFTYKRLSIIDSNTEIAEITDDNERAAAYREVMLRLPPCNYHFLRRVYVHFFRLIFRLF